MFRFTRTLNNIRILTIPVRNFSSINKDVTEFQLSRLRTEFQNYKKETDMKILNLEWKLQDLKKEQYKQTEEQEDISFPYFFKFDAKFPNK